MTPKKWKNGPHKLLIISPDPFISQSSPDHSPQPRIDFLYHEISGPDICSLICGTRPDNGHYELAFILMEIYNDHPNREELWKDMFCRILGPSFMNLTEFPDSDSWHCYFTILKHRKKGPFWFFGGPNDFIWSALKVWFSDFIQNLSQAPSKCLSEHKSGYKLDYLKNPSRDFKNHFCSRILWIPSNAEWQNHCRSRHNLISCLFIKNSWSNYT